MGGRKKKNDKLITSRQLYRMIAQSQDLPMEVVQDVITSLVECVYLATSEGYKINIPRMGIFNQREVKGKQEGDIKKISKVVYDACSMTEQNGVDYLVYEQDGGYLKKYLKDEKDYLLPNFKFNVNFREKCKERSKTKWEQ